jgi:uncharacterized protein YoxC
MVDKPQASNDLLAFALDLKEVLTGVQDLQQTVDRIVEKVNDIDNRVQRVERQVRTTNDQTTEKRQANDRLLVRTFTA